MQTTSRKPTPSELIFPHTGMYGEASSPRIDPTRPPSQMDGANPIRVGISRNMSSMIPIIMPNIQPSRKLWDPSCTKSAMTLRHPLVCQVWERKTSISFTWFDLCQRAALADSGRSAGAVTQSFPKPRNEARKEILGANELKNTFVRLYFRDSGRLHSPTSFKLASTQNPSSCYAEALICLFLVALGSMKPTLVDEFLIARCSAQSSSWELCPYHPPTPQLECC